MDGSTSQLPPDFKRHRFTAADVQAMIMAGVLREGDHHVELIGGELIEMSPQGPLHSEISRRMLMWLARNLPADLDVAANTPFRLADRDEPEPEFLVLPSAMDVNDVRGGDALLVVEIAHSSLSYDLGAKAALYARHGVRTYWVVDVENRRTLVHARQTGGGYGEPASISFAQPLAAPGGAMLVIEAILPKA